ncbi:MAG: D-alanyl-D-alanine carboxypeptidase/D-alanyl-D-alanine-endopeptidase [Flavobacterium sp.]|nr:D-alanyl-D-alanine carboxypeptidase/D-alanyl-D-alanine-endopeptidase [Flavobacterium sp.]
MRLLELLKNIRNNVFFIFILAAFSLYSQQKDTAKIKNQIFNSTQELKDQLEETFNDPNFSNGNWGVMIKSLKTGEILYKKNADKLFIPASNQKLFTTAAALILLGDKYYYETKLYLNGEIRNGKVSGDLIIKGVGDPTISSKFVAGGGHRVFEAWADSLKAKGITEVLGNIIGDDSAFDNQLLGKGWQADNEQFWFSAETGALSFNDNCLHVTIKPSIIGKPANLTVYPQTEYAIVENRITTVSQNEDEEISFTREHGTNKIIFRGKIKKNSKEFSEYVTITRPTDYFLKIFREILEKKGIKVIGKSYSIKNSFVKIDEEDLVFLYKHKSLLLRDIVKETNKNSNNFFAEQIFKTLGYEMFGLGSIENGLKASRELFNDMGINLDNMSMVDGSGLSRLNMVTPRHILNLLSYMYKSEVFEQFYNSLPIAGIDGSLSSRMRRTSAENNVHAKPGYNSGISALSGYVKTFEGEQLVFCMFVNNYLVPSSLATYIQDLVCIRLSNFSRN